MLQSTFLSIAQTIAGLCLCHHPEGYVHRDLPPVAAMWKSIWRALIGLFSGKDICLRA